MRNYVQEYIAYLKNNPERYWFKRKLFGWGWTPATKEGWGIMILWLVAVLGNILRIEQLGLSEYDTSFAVITQTTVLVLILLAICYKTGEKPRWQWKWPSDTKE